MVHDFVNLFIDWQAFAYTIDVDSGSWNLNILVVHFN